jgi:PD-(D/E)XK nuclease superfamily
MIPPLTNSEMAAFMNCRRGWYLTYYRKLRRKRDYASLPSIGNVYHMGLEAYYNEGRTDVVELVQNYMQGEAKQNPEYASQIAKDGELVAIMLEGYFEWLQETGADEGLRVLGAEMPVEVKLGETGFSLRGKIDTRLEREVDKAWLQLENKTVGNLTDIPRYAQQAPQFLTYDLLAFLKAKDEGARTTDGVIVNMARRVKRTSRANPPFYARHEVRHNPDELRAHYRHVVAIGREIERTRRALDAGSNHHDVCPPTISRNHTWSCNCASITGMFDDGSDIEAFLQDLYEVHDPWERYEEKEEK